MFIGNDHQTLSKNPLKISNDFQFESMVHTWCKLLTWLHITSFNSLITDYKVKGCKKCKKVTLDCNDGNI